MSATTNMAPPPALPELVSVPVRSAEFSRRLSMISRQSGVYFAGTILTAAAGYFFKIYLARALGKEALGLYALGMSVVSFLGLFNAVGLPATAARFVAEYKSRGEFHHLGTFLRGSLGILSAGNLLLGAVVISAGPWIAIHFYHAPALGSYFWFFVLIMFLGVLNTFLGQVMAGYQDVSQRTLITHFIGTPANIFIAVILISFGFGLRGYLSAQVLSAFLVLALLAICVLRLTPPEARAISKFGRVERKVIVFSVTAFGMAVIDFILSQSDKIIIGHYLDAGDVGVYAVATALVVFVPIALQSVNQIFSPTIAELHASGNIVLLQQLYTILTKWIVIFTLPLAFTLVFFSKPLMGIFGQSFEAGAPILVIGAIGQLFNCAVGSVGHLLVMSGHQHEMMRIQVCSAALMITLNFLLVPRMGIEGAAIASAVAIITTNLSSLVAVYRKLHLSPYNRSYTKLLLPTLTLVASLFMLLDFSAHFHSQWEIAASGLICAYASFLGTLLMLGLDEDDRKFANVVLRKMGIDSRIGAAF